MGRLQGPAGATTRQRPVPVRQSAAMQKTATRRSSAAMQGSATKRRSAVKQGPASGRVLQSTVKRRREAQGPVARAMSRAGFLRPGGPGRKDPRRQMPGSLLLQRGVFRREPACPLARAPVRIRKRRDTDSLGRTRSPRRPRHRSILRRLTRSAPTSARGRPRRHNPASPIPAESQTRSTRPPKSGTRDAMCSSPATHLWAVAGCEQRWGWRRAT